MAKALDGKIALITGASRGIGRAVALRYAQEGAHVILVAKTVASLEEVDDEIQALGGSATLVPMDLRDFDKIDQMGQALYDRFGKLDILVGNAGFLGDITPMAHLKVKMWNQVMDINVTANWRLIRSMEPLLKLSDAGRAIFLSSGTTKGPRAFWAAYAVSKAALENMVQTWAMELGKTKIKANLIDPGATRTRMRSQAYPGEDPQTLKEPEVLTDMFVELASPECEKQGEVVRYSE
ncbi:Short-chain dehydrogenase/reductase SDR [Candidatus Terasakiella magnetica]|uniref:Short-chain dehydrogenase/reductase SDR n=1 Tax=Candidatus Terasakiella magnetica TaxID=1867952 RepID=A0A1C3RJW7_9PROT|nr:SDR family NAD(P)-dependent oxidoreductase [Candidatus Terasakiella magnetica]SCA57539.1 Short-chain dehydrogenase/reductase SDR [Candidatus Terasakiella magnetica]